MTRYEEKNNLKGERDRKGQIQHVIRREKFWKMIEYRK